MRIRIGAEKSAKLQHEEITGSNGIIWDKSDLDRRLDNAELLCDKENKHFRPEIYKQQRDFFLHSIINMAAAEMQPYTPKPLSKKVISELKKLDKKEKESKLARFFKSPEIQKFFWVHQNSRLISKSEIQKENGEYFTADIPAREKLSGMSDALKSFVDESAENPDIRFKEHVEGGHTICMVKGNYTNLCIIYKNRGAKIWGLEHGLSAILENLEESYKNTIENWDGNLETIAGSEEKLCSELVKLQKKSKYKKISVGGFVGLATTLLSIAGTYHPEPDVPHAPTIKDIEDITLNAKDTLYFKIPASDPDGDALRYLLTFEENGTSLPINEVTGQVNIPSISKLWAGTHVLNATVRELSKYNLSASKLFNLTVKYTPPNELPYFDIKDVVKEKTAFAIKVHAKDNDTGVSRIEFRLDDILQDKSDNESYISNFDFGNLSVGQHILGFRALDAKNSAVYSDWNYTDNLTNKPVLENITKIQDKDNLTLEVKAYVEVEKVRKVVAELDDKKYETYIDCREGSGKISIPMDGLKIKDYPIKVYAVSDSNVISDIKEINATPYDDPTIAKFDIEMFGEDQLKWSFTAEDEEWELADAIVTANTPTFIEYKSSSDKTTNYAAFLSVISDLSKDKAGDYQLNGIARLSNGTEANATAHIRVVDNSPVIYAWTISPEAESNSFTVSVAGYDNDTIEGKFNLDVKGAANEHFEVPINSKRINFKIPLNYAANEPGIINLTGKLIPATGEVSPEYVVFENVSRTIFNERPIINGTLFTDYNPVDKELNLKGNVSDIDSKIAGGTYELINTKTGQKITGQLSATDGFFDNKTEDFNAVINLFDANLSTGNYNLTVRLKDAQGLEDMIIKQIKIDNNYAVIPVWNTDENAKDSELKWDSAKKVAYLKLSGNNTIDNEKVNDFEKITTLGLKNYVKLNWLNHVILDDPLQSAINIHRNVIMQYSAGKDDQSGYDDENRLAIDARTTYEWIKAQILNNLAIPQATRDKWNRFFSFSVNCQDNFQRCIFVFDADASGDISDYERWMTYQSLSAPSMYDGGEKFVTDWTTFTNYYGIDEAIKWSNRALIDATDMEWNMTGNGWGGIDSIFNTDETTAKYIGESIRNYNTALGNRTQLTETGNTLFSMHKYMNLVPLKGRILEIRYNSGAQKFDYVVKPLG